MRRLAVLGLLMLLTACGHKGPVRPLGQPLPDGVRQLQLEQFGDGLLLSWLPPKANQDGSPLAPIRHYAVYRQQFDPADDCPDCRPPRQPIARIRPEQATSPSGRIHFFDNRGLQPESGYRYRVVAVSRSRQPGLPAQTQRVFLPSPPAPGQLQGESLERLNRLRWQPPTAEGFELLGYLVYRGVANRPAGFTPLNAEPLNEARYDDFDLTPGVRYRYRVRALYRLRGQKVVSGASDALTLTARP
ncbi:hypothetical protein EDC39_11021 [Geothermobacter ehrlichii]|uniref:Fibronectin type-III domain-containing protein n=2 Tax=Geothermobacter ehrlichii TaxID=213224 RepID=A0A5D3WGC5_9BACT|nr:hypothetical protein EDC39_11021 [Geothermobacter ehrlichii]